MKLTERKIETLSVDRGRKDRLVFDDAQRGLAVRATASGGRTYLCQYTLNRQKWRVPLGSCSALSLSKAREAAAAVMGDVAKGRNPAAERKEAAAAEWAKRARGRLTLAVLIQDWSRLHLVHRRPRYAAEAVRALHHAFAKHLDRPAEDLDRATVVRALDSLSRRPEDRGGSRQTALRGTGIAGRTVAYGRACFAWAMKRGAVPSNPFAELPLSTVVNKRDRVLSDEEASAVWRAAGEATPPLRRHRPSIDADRPAPRRSGRHDLDRTFGRLGDLDDTCHADQERDSASRTVEPASTRSSARPPIRQARGCPREAGARFPWRARNAL
jgi:Arm DNA-binding domain